MSEFFVARQFSRTPGPRYVDEGDFSGELFRRDFLLPEVRAAIETGEILVVDLDGTAGYGTSFLEEAFGGLVREDKISAGALRRVLRLQSSEEDYLPEDIMSYIADAEASEDHSR